MDYGTNNNTLANLTTQTARAFTGHEQISELSGLIDMNARVYDSDIGRFLSADTVIQDPHDTQAYNRYSYVRNNPLKYTDPSGNSWWTKFRDKWVKPIAAIVVGAILVTLTGGALAGALGAFWGSVATGALAGAAGGAIMTGTVEGTLKGAAFGALSAGMAYGIGHGGGLFAKVRQYGGAVGKAVLHGLSRAAISKLQTGSGKGGFLGGFASSLLGGVVNTMQTASTTVKVTMAAIAGGTASVLGGGKFSNGAMSGAFIMMFNELGKPYLMKNSLSTEDIRLRDQRGRMQYNKQRLANMSNFMNTHRLNDDSALKTFWGIVTLPITLPIAGLGALRGALFAETAVVSYPMETMMGIGVADNLFMGGTPATNPLEQAASLLHDSNPWGIK